MQNMPHWIRYDFLSTSISANANRIRGAFEQIVKRIMNRQSEADQPNLRRYFGGAGPVDAKLKNFRAKYRGYVGYRPSQFKGRAIVFRARAQSMSDPLIGAMGWQYFIEPVPQVRVVKGSHVSMMRSPYVGEISPFLKQSFDNKGTGRPRV